MANNNTKNKTNRRLDKNRVTLRKGEYQRSDGRYCFRWNTRDGKRHCIYGKTLDELRRKETELTVDQFDGIRTDKQHTTVNDMFELWCELKRGLKDNTFQNYKYMYNNFVRNNFGRLKIVKGDNNGCSFAINSTKTPASFRTIPMLECVKEAFLLEKAYQEEVGISSNSMVDGFTNFVFVNRFGNVQHQGTLNKAIRRIIRDCNDEVLLKGQKEPTLLPPFSCHSLRHTFATRLCENGVNIKVIQELLGHSDFSTTMDIYTDVTKDLKEREINKLNGTFSDMMIITPSTPISTPSLL